MIFFVFKSGLFFCYFFVFLYQFRAMKTSLKLNLRTNTNKDGTTPLYITLAIGDDRKRFPIQINLLKQHWDPVKQKVIKMVDADYYNLLIKKHLQKANTILFDYEIKDKKLTHEIFEKEFYSHHTDNKSFFVWAREEMERSKSEYAKDTYRSMLIEINKLQRFTAKLTFDDLSPEFLRRYQKYMKLELKNKVNTIHKAFKTIRTLLFKAINQNITENNPFKKFKLKTEETDKTFLTMKELERIENCVFAETNKTTLEIGVYFLFACYTGVRFGDMRKLKEKNINNGFLIFKMRKVNRVISIPLISKVKLLVEKYANKTGYLFNVHGNQVTNDYLKMIAAKSNIKKNVSFHTARHSFATNSLSLGIPIEVVSKLLGHSSIKTTMIYSHLMDAEKIKQIDKWNQV